MDGNVIADRLPQNIQVIDDIGRCEPALRLATSFVPGKRWP
ncbi:hypothetical protein RHOER0001_4885 [Rhodococcus erythropolis SK121]|nr:hypothetical protein RHOER0001_4885 [Rhodococcus erythropolis SK121]